MTEAAERMGRKSADSARRTLASAGVKFERIGKRTLAVRESDLEKVIAAIGENRKPGRPHGSTAKTPKPKKKD